VDHCRVTGDHDAAHRLSDPGRRALEAALEDAGQLSPPDRATARMHLGALLAGGSSDEHGIEMCRLAAHDLSPETLPELWAIARRYLAEALLQAIRHAGRPLRGAAIKRPDEALQAARAATSVLPAHASHRRAQVTLVDALIALGEQRSDAALLDEAVAIGREVARQPTAEPSWREAVDAHAALGNALLARARLGGDDPALLRAAVGAHRAALMTAYHAIGSFRSLACWRLGAALQAAGLGAVAAGDNPSAPLSWALDALATVMAVQDANAGMGTLAAMKTVAARQGDPRLWEAWAVAIARVGSRLGRGAASERLFQELADCLDAHGTPDMRLAWAEGAGAAHLANPLPRQQQIVAHIRALADRHDDEPALLVAWAKGALGLASELARSDVAAAARLLDDMKATADATGDPEIRTMWARAVCDCLAMPGYVDADLDRARSRLAETKAHADGKGSSWPRAAARIHDVLLARDEAAADALRDEIKAFAQAAPDEDPWPA